MTKPVSTLVLDATPLITQPASSLQQFAEKFYTTPGVKAELKDELVRNQLIIWGDALQVRQPKQLAIDKVSSFAKLSGDYNVLSMNDIHIIALAYELEVEKNGDAHLRRFPGQVLESEKKAQEERAAKKAANAEKFKDQPKPEEPEEGPKFDEDGFEIVTNKKKSKRGSRPKAEAKPVEEPKPEPEVPEEPKEESKEELNEEYNEDDDNGDWITPENLQEEMRKDKNESVQEANEEGIPVALSTGDFACQNVTMQIGLKLMNPMSGKQIVRVRNYMYRCHACFAMTPMSKNGQPRHFCPRCGGSTLLRCAVSIDKDTGKITPHLKKNFQWITRGLVYSVASPLSKNLQKNKGNRGHQHALEGQDTLILREDQKEYAKALKNDAWQRKQSEKALQEFIGGGSADNFISPFGATYRPSGVRVGKGRYVNSAKGRR